MSANLRIEKGKLHHIYKIALNPLKSNATAQFQRKEYLFHQLITNLQKKLALLAVQKQEHVHHH